MTGFASRLALGVACVALAATSTALSGAGGAQGGRAVAALPARHAYSRCASVGKV